MKTLFGDLETYCTVPIANGTFAYAEQAEVMLFPFAIDDEEPQVWDLTSNPYMPTDLAEAWIDDDVLKVFHNSMFDRTVMSHASNWRWGVPPIECWHDTMVQAYAHSLPGGLEKLCTVLQLPVEQFKQAGKTLIHLFCKPRPKNSKIVRATRHTHPEDWAKFVEYAKHDVISMREVYRKLPRWNNTALETALWQLDQRINDRGICVDLPLVDAAIRAVAKEKETLDEYTQVMTNNEVQAATQRDKLLAHLLVEHGVDLPDMTADTLERRMQDPDLPIEVKNILGVRLESTTASVAKYRAVRRGVSADGRLRGTHQFNGAARTGRWAHRGFQPGNLPRPTMKPDEIAFNIEAIKADAAHLICPSVMRATSNAIRGVIVAPKGKKLCVADLSNIEGRKAAWLAGEQWKLQAFRQYDEGIGEDLYKVSYASSFGIAAKDVDKPQRQIGKVQELMLQYEGGVGAFVTGAETYGIDLDALVKAAWDTIPHDVLKEATEFRTWMIDEKGGNDFGLAPEVFIVCDSIKRLWRARHPQIVSYWPQLRDTAIKAIETPGQEFPCRKVTMVRTNNWLRIILPSGRNLCYPQPRAKGKSISYMGVNPYTRRWQRIPTYGGKLLENITQAASRDTFTSSMPEIEKRGYDTVLLVHDENVTEAPDSSEFSGEQLAGLMSVVPSWATGLPLAAAGYETYRYRKD